MSTATQEKPVTALGSFIGKLTPKPVEKPAEKPLETKADATPPAVPDTKPADKPVAEAAVEHQPAAAVPKSDAEPKPADKADTKPKEDVNEKRLKDTQKWGNEEHKARLEAERKNAILEAQLARIEAKLDGTYEEPTAPSAEQITADADIKGRIRASHKAAIRQYGEAFVMETVWNPESLYQALQAKSPAIKARVMSADDPVLEAIAVVKEHQDGEKYGTNVQDIRKKVREEEKELIKQEILEGLKPKPGPTTNTLGNVRGGTERTEQGLSVEKHLNLGSVFPHGRSRT